MKTVVQAEPEAITLDTNRTALIVVDMQNSFCKKSGMMDYCGKIDESMTNRVISVCQKVIEISRKAKIPVLYLRMTYGTEADADLGPESPYYWKEKGLAAVRRNPELAGRFLTVGTWDWEIVDELKPLPGDISINKGRFSGFVNTELDTILKSHNIKYTVFIGLFTSICVESTLRDAFSHEYFALLVSDACGNIGPDYLQEATVWNVASVFGWVTTSADLLKALK